MIPLVATVALGKAPKPTRPPAPTVSTVPTVPGPSSVPWSPARVPALVGHTEVVTDKNLSRDTASMVFEFDLGGLDLEPPAVDALFWLLAADPGWRVGLSPHGRVATRREDGPGLDGWHVRPGHCVRLAVTEARSPQFDSPWLSAVSAGAATARVTAYQPTGGPDACRDWSTALAIDGARLHVEIFEAGPVDDRSFTLSALQELPRSLAYARLDAAALLAGSHRDPPPPRGVPRYEPGPGPGTVVVERWLNPGAPGTTWMRLVDSAGNAVADNAVGPQTLQLAGWSVLAEHQFRVGTTLVLPPGPAFDGTAEWWFSARDGAVRRLASDPVHLPAR